VDLRTRLGDHDVTFLDGLTLLAMMEWRGVLMMLSVLMLVMTMWGTVAMQEYRRAQRRCG
jgi:hypothetical protein